MSIITIILLIVFFVLLQFTPIYVVRAGEVMDDEEVIQGFYFTRAPLFVVLLMIYYYGWNNIKIVSGRTFYRAYNFVEERQTTSKN